MKNKKAEIEKAVTFPILILIVLIMGLFIFLSATIAQDTPVNIDETLTPFASENLLLQIVKINGTEMLVYDALSLMLQGKVREDDLKKELQSLLTNESNCYLLIDIAYSDGKTGAANNVWGHRLDSQNNLQDLNDFGEYEEQKKLTLTKIESMRVERYYQYYYGRCI